MISTLRELSTKSRFSIALILAFAAFGFRYVKSAAEPGIDFWRPWAVVSLLRDRPYSDIYSRAGREVIVQQAVFPLLQSAESNSPEREAARISLHYDTVAIGYEGIDVVHTPCLLATIRPFTALTYARAHRLYVLLSLLSFFTSSYLLSRLLGVDASISLLVGAVGALIFRPEWDEMMAANVNNFQLLIVALFLCLQRAPRSGAIS